MSGIKKNLGLQTVYQILSVCMPLITAPYLARRLGASQLGVFSYTSSVVTYFALFAMLGTANYGTRCIAAAKGNRKKINELFTSIFLLQIIVTLIAILAYALYLLFICKSNYDIATLQGIALLSCLCDINWLFWGVEDFKITVTRSLVIKIVSLILILSLVNNQSDLWKYTLIMLGGTFFSNLVLFLYIPRYASFVKVSVQQIKMHIQPNLILFVPLLAMSVYHAMDKTMLGALSTFEQSGFYYNSDKIVQIPLLVVNGIGTVMLPRMSTLVSEKKIEQANYMFMTTIEGVVTISLAFAFGIAAISREFIPLFLGSGYEQCILITIAFTPILFFKGLSIIVRNLYLIPMEMEKEFTKSVVGGAVVNLFFNMLFIPKFGAFGATIATVVAEMTAWALQFKSLTGKGFGVKKILKLSIKYFVFGVVMLVVVRCVSFLFVNIFIKILFEVISGAFVYGCLCFLYWSRTNNSFYSILIKPILNKMS